MQSHTQFFETGCGPSEPSTTHPVFQRADAFDASWQVAQPSVVARPRTAESISAYTKYAPPLQASPQPVMTDAMAHSRLDDANFDPANFSNHFVLPRFAAGGQGGDFAYGPAVVEAMPTSDALISPMFLDNDGKYPASNELTTFGSSRSALSGGSDDFSMSFKSIRNAQVPTVPMGPPPKPSLLVRRAASFNFKARQQVDQDADLAQSSAVARPQTGLDVPLPPTQALSLNTASPAVSPVKQLGGGPIYDTYGSSYTALFPHDGAAGLLPPGNVFAAPSIPPTVPFDPRALGLPVPSSSTTGKNWRGLYSTSGFDFLGVLSRVATRPNPEIQVGPVDSGCSFIVSDARKPDQPIVYASDTFSKLTGYSNEEIVGRNCRFLQAPDGIVAAGEPRMYSDSAAAYHMKRHLMAGKESQASLINYCKGGKPFINLVTVIPITWDSDEIAYYVGFQVDLVEQPAAILEKMKSGHYVVNYSLVGNAAPRQASSVQSHPSVDTGSIDVTPAVLRDAALGQAGEPMAADVEASLLHSVTENGLDSVDETTQSHFRSILLDSCEDFVHVLSLKGQFLYVSSSCSRLLEYEPGELIGKTLASLCHPSDIVAVLRELKEAGSVNHPTVNLMFRIRRKRSGYMWLEAPGKLFSNDQGKTKKSVILVGRPRDVYNMSWDTLEQAGGLGQQEFWSKMTLDGMLLYTTSNVNSLLGFTSDELLGTALSRLVPEEAVVRIRAAIKQAVAGRVGTVRHQMRTKTGAVDVVTHIFPSNAEVLEESVTTRTPATVIAQTSIYSSIASARPKLALPKSSRASTSYSGRSSSGNSSSVALVLPDCSASNDSGNSSAEEKPAKSGFATIPSTFKTLTSNASNNVFDELETTRGTSWQYELHQLRLTNKKLREEKNALAVLQKRKRRRDASARDGPSKKAAVSSSPGSGGPRTCANCGRSGSPEWRSGPTGPKTLCNACGLRWAKARQGSLPSASAAPASMDSGARSPSLPQSEIDSGREYSSGASPFPLSLPIRPTHGFDRTLSELSLPPCPADTKPFGPAETMSPYAGSPFQLKVEALAMPPQTSAYS